MTHSQKTFWGVAAVALLIVVAISASGLFTGLDLFFQDTLVQPKSVDGRIVIVAIDDASLQEIGQWPWPREVFAKTLERLAAYDPAVIGVDVMFSEPSRLGGADDALLARALSTVSIPIVFPLETPPVEVSKNGARAASVVMPLPQFSNAPSVSLGHVNLFLDSDGKARRFPRIVETPIGSFPSFSEVTAKRGVPGGELYPLPPGDVHIAYAAPSGTIRRVPFSRVLGEEDLSAIFKGAVVFIGATAADLHDEKPTPMSRGQEMPGVEIQANIANMFLKGHTLHDVAYPVLILWCAVLTALLTLIFIYLKRLSYAFLAACVVFIISFVKVAVFFENGYVVSFVYTTLTWIFVTAGLSGWRYILLRKDRALLESMFGKYVSGAVLREILNNPHKVALGGEEREVTVFFSDIRGFTSLSEKMKPTDLLALLNNYFDVMSAEILSHDGVLDKYIGDAIMAFWGAPLADDQQADHAIEAGRAMLRILTRFNADLQEKGMPPIDIGVGIATGPVVVGNVGSRDRFDYTVIGDTVNLASRLEGLNKEKGTHLIVSESTKNAAKGNYIWRELGAVQVKGREQAVRVYTIDEV